MAHTPYIETALGELREVLEGLGRPAPGTAIAVTVGDRRMLITPKGRLVDDAPHHRHTFRVADVAASSTGGMRWVVADKLGPHHAVRAGGVVA